MGLRKNRWTLFRKVRENVELIGEMVIERDTWNKDSSWPYLYGIKAMMKRRIAKLYKCGFVDPLFCSSVRTRYFFVDCTPL